MAVVADPDLGSKPAWRRAVWSFAAAMVSLAILIAFASFYLTARFQQDQIRSFSEASACRAQRSMDGIVEILDSIVLLGNRQPLNFDEIANVSERARKAVEECA